MIYDIIVVGAGPGGSYAAKSAAENGYKVLLLEKEKLEPNGRYKACGGAMAWELVEEVNFPQDKIARVIESLTLHHVDGEMYEKKGKGAIVWRSVFDYFLTLQSVEAGATLMDQCPLKEIEPVFSDKNILDHYNITTPKGQFKGKYIFAADGVNSPTLKQLSWPKFPPEAVVVTITKEMKCSKEFIKEKLGDEQVHLYFGIDKLMSLGYAWLFPKEDTITVGWGNNLAKTLVIKDQLKKFWNLPIVKDLFANSEEVIDKAHLIPVDVRSQIYHQNVFAIGDAGGFVDPISGKGIPYAMLSGKIAVESLKYAERKERLEKLGDIYLKRLNKTFLEMFKYKRELRIKIYQNDENLKKFLELWQGHRSSEIVLQRLFT